MDIKHQILSRAVMSFILVVVACVLIIGKAANIQVANGKYWRSLNDSLHIRTIDIAAERGTIYSEDGKMLSTSIPEFDIFIDFTAQGLRANKGKKFFDNIDSLAYCLSNLFKDKTEAEYKQFFVREYKKNKETYKLFKQNLSYKQYKELLNFPLVRLGKNTSGFITQVNNKRLNPYGMLAYRTIGLDREVNKVGLELSYDSVLKGVSGQRTVRFIAGGVAVPINEMMETETQNGKDVVTTLDVFIQEVTENALLKMMYKNQAHQGTAIVMETKTGKIKAIANLGLDSSTIKTKSQYDISDYYELKNYALLKSEPGSTFKLATLLALLDDRKINLNTTINIGNGTWEFAKNATVIDADGHKTGDVSAKEGFMASSNVAMAKMAWNAYGANPNGFISKLHNLRLDTASGIELVGESNPTIHKPGTKFWQRTTLPWMAHGYNVSVTPMQTLTLYNAIANKGKMMKPYLVNSFKAEGITIKSFEPKVLNEKICNDSALKDAIECLTGVCHNTAGTAYKLFKESPYKVAGKTGTSYYVSGNIKYDDRIYQSSFAGFFPADNPQYTCVVIIVNKPNSLLRFGGEVAAPVFKEISDRLYTTYVKNTSSNKIAIAKTDSDVVQFIGNGDDIKSITKNINLCYKEPSVLTDEWVKVHGNAKQVAASTKPLPKNLIPSLKGMCAKDAVYICEGLGLKVNVNGKGKVQNQSIIEGSRFLKGQTINIYLN